MLAVVPTLARRRGALLRRHATGGVLWKMGDIVIIGCCCASCQAEERPV